MPLTDTACKNTKPAAKPYKKADAHGLYLQVMPNGAKYWRHKYRFLGKEKLLALGVYPEVSLADARSKRDEARKLLDNGIDPSMAKAEQKQLASLNAENTFKAIALEWHETNKERWTPAYAANILHRMEIDIFPKIGSLPVADVKPPQLLTTIKAIEKRGAQEVAHRLLQNCGQIFRYAIVTGRADRNPAADLRGALKPLKHSHFAALEAKDLPEFLQALERNAARLFPQTRLAILLMAMTFVRTSELINAKWEEFDLDAKEWVIPAHRMKMRKAHIVPLSTQAIEALRELQSISGQFGWVFPSVQKMSRPISNNTILKALERMGYKGKATGHGFRALAMSTIKEKLNYRHEVVDRQLAHAPRNKVDAAYDRAQFLPERRKMMQDWSNYLDVAASQGKVLYARFGREQ